MSSGPDYTAWMRRTLELAVEAAARGDEPFGALLVRGDEVVMEARNAINTTGDVTQHAETRLVSKATAELAHDVVAATTLITSTEPCAMCCGAIYWSGIGRLVFGCPADRLERIAGGGGLHRPSRVVLGDASPPVAIEGPVLEEEAAAIHERYWQASG